MIADLLLVGAVVAAVAMFSAAALNQRRSAEDIEASSVRYAKRRYFVQMGWLAVWCTVGVASLRVLLLFAKLGRDSGWNAFSASSMLVAFAVTIGAAAVALRMFGRHGVRFSSYLQNNKDRDSRIKLASLVTRSPTATAASSAASRELDEVEEAIARRTSLGEASDRLP